MKVSPKGIQLSQFSKSGNVKLKTSDIPNLIENSKNLSLITLFEPTYIENMYNDITIDALDKHSTIKNEVFTEDKVLTFAAVNNNLKKFSMVKCEIETLVCKVIKEVDLEIEAKSLVVTESGFYLTFGNPVNFMKISFEGHVVIESYLYLTTGVKNIHFFDGKYLGRTEDSLFEL